MKLKTKKKVSPKPLTSRQRLFAVAVASGSTHIDAMRKAGYAGKPGTLSVEANRLLKLPKIAEYVERSRVAVEKTLLTMNAEEILQEQTIIAQSDIADFLDYDGKTLRLKPFHLMDPRKRRAIQSLELKKGRLLPKLHAKAPALDRLGQWAKLWGDKLSVQFPGDALDRGMFAIPGFDPAGGVPARP